jgi:hypothetical protein
MISIKEVAFIAIMALMTIILVNQADRNKTEIIKEIQISKELK